MGRSPGWRPAGSSAPRVERMKRLGGRLLLAILPLLLLVLACELILRAAGPAPADSGGRGPERAYLTCEHDSLLGWIFPAGAVGDFEDDGSPVVIETNAWGLRGPEYDPAPEDLCVVVLGDSYAFGWGVEEEASFPRQLERLLREHLGAPTLTVINAGIPGYGPYQQIAMLRQVRRYVTPDLVIATFSLANDPVDELRIARYAPDRLQEYDPALREPDAFLSRLSRHSRTASLLDQRTRSWQLFGANAGAEARRLMTATWVRLIDECRQDGVPLIMVVVPQRNQILRGGGLAGWFAGQLTGELRALPREIARRHGVPLVDLGPTLAVVQQHQDAFLPHDAHWTTAGHRAAAQAIADALPAVWPDPAEVTPVAGADTSLPAGVQTPLDRPPS